MTTNLSVIASLNHPGTHKARIPYPIMLKQTCLVKASRILGAVFISPSREKGRGSAIEARELQRVGELTVLLYARAPWTSSILVISSRDPSLSVNGLSVHGLHTLFRSHWPSSRPRSGSCFLSSCVSSRNSTPTARPKMTTAAQTKFGRRYLYVSKMVSLNMAG